MEDYAGSLAQGSVLYSDSADWEAHAGPVDVKMCRPSFIPNHIKLLQSGSDTEKLAAARVLTILTSEDAATLDVGKSRVEIASAGAPAALIKIMSASDAPAAEDDTTIPLAKEAAAATLCNLCAQDDSRALVVEAGGIPALVGLIDHEPSDELLKYACGALGNLARESVENQEAIAGVGGIPKLIGIARTVGIREDGEEATKETEDAEDDTGLELNASIALRKLAVANAANYKAMQDVLSESELRYFLHGELPADGLVPEAERAD